MASKAKITLILILIGAGLFYLSVEFFFPRDLGVAGSIDGKTIPFILEKVEQDNQYYISFKDKQRGNKEIRLECTKAQYDFITYGQEYHLTYKTNFFNRSIGKITKLDNKPIYSGNSPIALYKEFKIRQV